MKKVESMEDYDNNEIFVLEAIELKFKCLRAVCTETKENANGASVAKTVSHIFSYIQKHIGHIYSYIRIQTHVS